MLSEEFKSEAELKKKNINWDRSIQLANDWAGKEALNARKRLRAEVIYQSESHRSFNSEALKP